MVAAARRSCPSGPTSGSAIWRRYLSSAPADIDIGGSAAAGDRGNDRDLVRVFDRRVQVLQEANVLVVGEDVHEAAHLAVVVADAFLDAGVLRLEARDERPDRAAGRGDLFFALRQLAK